MNPSQLSSNLRELDQSVPQGAAAQRWPQLVAKLRAQQASGGAVAPGDYLALWQCCFATSGRSGTIEVAADSSTLDSATSGSQANHLPPATPIWFPDAAALEQSNVGRWMSDLSTNSEVKTYADFHRWSALERGEFWRQAIERLGVRFRRPPTNTLDDRNGADRAAWLAGAELNIAESCFLAPADSIAIVTQTPGRPIRRWTVGELQARASQVANSLVDAGFKVGDSLGVVMPMTDWSVAIYLGIVMAGCNVVSIADSFAPPEIATRLRISNAKAVFTYDHQTRAGKQLPLYRRVAEAAEIPAIVLCAGEILSVDLRDQDRDWSEFLVERTRFEPVACQVQETINILFSSGTTGEPKAIPWSHLTPIKCAVDGYCHQNIQPGDVCAWPTNLGWMMGPWLIFASLINRATIALYEDAPMGAGFGQFVQDAGVTMLGVVPTIVKAWQSSGDMESCDWSAIKVFSSTGESSQAETMAYLSALGQIKPIIEYCGGTEVGGGYVSSVVVLPNVPAAFNTAAMGMDFVLIDQQETSEGQGSVVASTQAALVADEGEVFLLPPSIGLSSRLINRDHHLTYYANTPVIEGLGVLRRHGDYFRSVETAAGKLYFAGGRADDTMNLGGIKISSAELERVMNQTPGVLETAAIAVSSADGPDALVVFAVPGPTEEESEGVAELAARWRNEMNQRLKHELNPLFKVSAVRIADSLPRTASGKVMRRKLRDAI